MKMFSMCRGCGRTVTVGAHGICRHCLPRYLQRRRIQLAPSEKKR